jgi:hypothetical protein
VAAVLHSTAAATIDANSSLFWRGVMGELSMRRGAAVFFLVASFHAYGRAEPGIQTYVTAVDPLNGLIAVAEVSSPPDDVGARLWAWDHIKSSSNVPELEAFAARYQGSFLAELARRRIEALESQRRIRPEAPLSVPN